MHKVEMLIVCDLKSAALVEDVLKGTASTVHVKTHVGPHNGNGTVSGTRHHTKTKTFKYANGVKNKGITGPNLFRELLVETKSMTINELTEAFQKRGFAAGSAGAVISKARAEGWAVQCGDGSYTLV